MRDATSRRTAGGRGSRRGAPGMPPGTLLERSGASPSRVVLRRFGPDLFEETTPSDTAELVRLLRDRSSTLWVEVTGLADTDTIAAVGRECGVHSLSLEDVLDPNQRAKVEQFEAYTFVVMTALSIAERVESHPLSIILADGLVVTLQDVETGALEPVRRRLQQASGRIRARGADYLAYAMIDSVVDHYFPVMEKYDDRLEHVEETVFEVGDADPIELTRHARRDLQTIRRAVWPAREVVLGLMREDTPRISQETRVHLRDCYDHLAQLHDMVEVSREIVAGLLETYISRVSLASNEVMKVLTVIATIFIPLTFIAGVYGMNFDPGSSPWNMPELDWRWGYPVVLALMAVVAGGSLLYFRRRGWLGGRRR